MPAMKTPPSMANLTLRSEGFFLASFLDSWPERLVTNSTSRRIWDTLHKGFMEADAVYGAHNNNHRDLRRETATSIGNVRTTQVNFECNINRSWMDTLARVDENECVIQATLSKLSGSLESLVATLAATTDCHDALLKEISASVQKQGSQLKAQSGILRTITRHNETLDACLLTVEGDLVGVNGNVATFDACLQGLRTTTEATTSALRTDVNNVRARVIPNLRRDLHNELQESTRGLTAAVQAVDTTIQEALARIHTLPPAGVPAASLTPAPVHSPTATAPINDLPVEDPTMRTDNSAGLTAARGVPNNPRIGFLSFRSPDHCSHDSITHGEDPALRYQSHEFHPPPLDMTAASSGAPRGGPKGGPIVSPHARIATGLPGNSEPAVTIWQHWPGPLAVSWWR
jgi:hypothetical protein